MPKPLSTAGLSLTQVYGSVAEDLKKRIGDAQAAQAGPPVSEEIVPNTEELQVKAWNARNPAATDEAMLALARQKYQEHIAAGMTPDVAQRATAEDLTHFRYDQRLTLYTHGQVDFAEQVAEAKRLAKLAARKTTPNPPMPPPSMPSSVLTNLQSTPGLAEQLGVPPVGMGAAPAVPVPSTTTGLPEAVPPQSTSSAIPSVAEGSGHVQPPPAPGGY